IGLCLQVRNQGGQGRFDVAPQVQLGGVAKAHLLWLQINLDRSRLAGLGQELSVRVVGTEQKQRVAASHLIRARSRAQQSQLLRVERDIRGYDLLSPQRG